jgi:Fe(3+) dicitrate transport protein
VGSFVLPIDLMYTYTDATASEDLPDEGIEDGDKLAVIPENTFSLRLGLEAANGWGNYAVVKYTDEMCMDLGCNNGGSKFDRSEDLLVVDYISRFAVTDSALLFLKVENLFDEQSIVSRQPDGARPNKPRTASVGVEFTF